MDRRLLITAFACWPAAGLRAQGAPAQDAPTQDTPSQDTLEPDVPPRPRHKVSAAELYEALAARFPLRMRLAGVLDLQVSAPRLLLLPARNKLGAALVAELGGPQSGQLQGGEMEVLFALRYEPTDQTLRGHHAEIRELRWPGLPAETALALRAVLPALAQGIGELVLHRFSPRELALPDTMGFEPDRMQVVDDGLVILFGPKPRR